MDEISETTRIYITYKARMIAESKYRLFSALSNLLVIWYSFWLIVASISEVAGLFNTQYFGVFSAAASIAIFAASIFVSTGTMNKTACEHRACYLELQKIFQDNIAELEKMKKYEDALQRYPNHTLRDYHDLLFLTWYQKGDITNAKGKVPIGIGIIFETLVRKLCFWIMAAVFFFAPITILI